MDEEHFDLKKQKIKLTPLYGLASTNYKENC